MIVLPIRTLPPVQTRESLAPLYEPFRLDPMQQARVEAQRAAILRAAEVRSSSSFIRL